jgi:hypothetical protein
VSTRPEAWDIIRPEAAPSTKSKLSYILPEGNISGATGTDVTLAANVTTLYFVDRIEYTGGNLRNFFADEEDLVNDYFGTAYSGDAINWLKELSDAKAKFKVYYYTGPNSEQTGKTRDIGMAEYLKSINDGKSTALQPSGNPNSSALADNTIYTAGNVDDPYNLVLRVFYYNTTFTGNTSAAWSNPALVPVKVFTYSNIVATRKANTEQLGSNNAQVLGGPTTEALASLQKLRTRLQEYYDVKVAYTDGTETIYSKALPAAKWPSPNSGSDWDFENTAPDEADVETRTLLIPFAVPPSAGNDTVEIEFLYDVLK